MTSDITLGRQYFSESVQSFYTWQPWQAAIADYCHGDQGTLAAQPFIDKMCRGGDLEYDSGKHTFIKGTVSNTEAAQAAAKEHAHYLLNRLVSAAMPESETAKQSHVLAFLE